jgi:hypothetical protein
MTLFCFLFQSFSLPLRTATRGSCAGDNCVAFNVGDTCFFDLTPGTGENYGGGIYANGGSTTTRLNISNCCFSGCTAPVNGGALWAKVTYFTATRFAGQQCYATGTLSSGDFIHVDSGTSTELNDSSTFLGGRARSGSTMVKSGSLNVYGFNATENYGASQNTGNGLNVPDDTVVLALVRFHSNGPHNCLYLNQVGESTGRMWCIEFFNNTSDDDLNALIRSGSTKSSTYRFDYCSFRSNSGLLADSYYAQTLIFTDCTFTEGEVTVGSVITLTTPGCRALASEDVHLDAVECGLGPLPATTPLPSPRLTNSPIPTLSTTSPATLSLPQPIFL